MPRTATLREHPPSMYYIVCSCMHSCMQLIKKTDRGLLYLCIQSFSSLIWDRKCKIVYLQWLADSLETGSQQLAAGHESMFKAFCTTQLLSLSSLADYRSRAKLSRVRHASRQQSMVMYTTHHARGDRDCIYRIPAHTWTQWSLGMGLPTYNLWLHTLLKVV